MVIRYRKPETLTQLMHCITAILLSEEWERDPVEETLIACKSKLEELEKLERDYEAAAQDIDWLLDRHENEHLRCRFCIHYKVPEDFYKCCDNNCMYEYGHKQGQDHGHLPH